MKFNRTLLSVMAGLLLLQAVPASAETDTDYERYARIRPAAGEPRDGFLDKLLAVPAYPFDLLRKGIDESIYLTEKYRLPDKAEWLYHQFTNRGFYPKLVSFGPKLDVDLVKLAQMKDRFPYVRAYSGIGWVPGELFRVETEIGFDKLQETGPYGSFFFDYDNRPNENFYGLGPDTSLGDSARYRQERADFELRGGYALTLNTDVRGGVAYEHVNIWGPERGGNGILDSSLPGANGANLLVYKLEFQRDSRDFPDDPHTGGLARFHFSYHNATEGDNIEFFKYRTELTRHTELFTERNTLHFRYLSEFNRDVSGQDVSFFDMARLGGYGVYPWQSDTLRGYRRNRFFGKNSILFNLEYRYNVYQYRLMAIDTVLFWDVGQVWNRDIQFKDFTGSYGGGFWIKYARKPLISLQIAKSGEGFEVYGAHRLPF